MLDISSTYSVAYVFGAIKQVKHNSSPSPWGRLGGGLIVKHLFPVPIQSTPGTDQSVGAFPRRRGTFALFYQNERLGCWLLVSSAGGGVPTLVGTEVDENLKNQSITAPEVATPC
jgi:hypothetical protein